MADRSYFRQLICAGCLATLALAGCNTTTTTPAAPPVMTMAQNEELLRKQAEVMQRTILEGAIAGAATGGGIGFAIGGNSESAQTGARIGLFTGAAAGTYVAFIQRKYLRRERRLDAIQEDLDKNAIEMQTTINVMQEVLAVQKAELAALTVRAAAGEDVSGAIGAEVSQAQANLAEMEKAIAGASGRQAEFGEARGLTLARGETTSRLDPELAALAAQIDAMKTIAEDLSQTLGEA